MLSNFALAANGTTVTGENTSVGSPSRTINGYRHTNNKWPDVGSISDGGGWGTTGVFPSTITYDLGQTRKISRIDIFTIADAIQYNINPSLVDTFSSYGLIAFNIDYWNGSAWINIVEVVENNRVWRQFTFPEKTFRTFRVVCVLGFFGASRLVEVEAWGAVPTEFKRPYSAFIDNFFESRAALNSRAYNTEIAFEITLRDATVLRYASSTVAMDSLSQGSISVPIPVKTFTPKIEGKPEFRHTQTKAVDISQFEAVNLDYYLTEIIANPARLFDNASVIAYLCFPKPNGNYEGLIYGKFEIADFAGDDEHANIQAVSDVAAQTATLGRELTQRCLNELGDVWCGVTHLPAGAICTKIWADKTGGCQYWGGVFNGVPYINPSGYVPGYTGTYTGEEGFEPSTPPGGGGCPDPSLWFRSANGGYIQGKELKEGEVILYNKTPVLVQAVEPIHAAYRYYVETPQGARFLGSASHRFLTGFGDDKGMPLHEWKKDFNYIVRTPQLGRSLISGGLRMKPTTPGMVLGIYTTFPNKYDCGMDKGFTIESHNKPIYQDILGGNIY